MNESTYIHGGLSQFQLRKKNKAPKVFYKQTYSEALSSFVCLACIAEYNWSVSGTQFKRCQYDCFDFCTCNGQIVNPAWMAYIMW